MHVPTCATCWQAYRLSCCLTMQCKATAHMPQHANVQLLCSRVLHRRTETGRQVRAAGCHTQQMEEECDGAPPGQERTPACQCLQRFCAGRAGPARGPWFHSGFPAAHHLRGSRSEGMPASLSQGSHSVPFGPAAQPEIVWGSQTIQTDHNTRKCMQSGVTSLIPRLANRKRIHVSQFSAQHLPL